MEGRAGSDAHIRRTKLDPLKREELAADAFAVAPGGGDFGLLRSAVADDQMRHLVDRKLFRATRLLMWLLRWRTIKNQRPFRIRDLAPKMRLDASTVVRTGDGCLWDTRALVATALCGLVHDRQHYGGRPIVFVLATERFNIREWWADEPRQHDLFPEPALFSGKIADHRERTLETSQGFCYVYTRCMVRRESCAISGWIPDNFSVDVVVVVVLADYLNSVPFNKFRKWGLFEDASSSDTDFTRQLLSLSL